MDIVEHARNRVHPGEHLLVALSGGIDSVALLHALLELRNPRSLTISGAHLDHGLRPESPADVAFCRDLCRQLDVPLREDRVQIRAELGGLENSARRQRYEWLESIRSSTGADRIATAHHQDDHAESLLLSLFRGTGLPGMRGIRAETSTLVRPFRDVPRAEIERYAASRNLEWREDLSNRSRRFRRNRVRHELRPLLADIFEGDPGARLVDFARRVETDLDALEAAGEILLKSCRLDADSPGVRIRRGEFVRQDKSLQFYALRGILRRLPTDPSDQRWNEANTQRVLDAAALATPGRRFPLPGGGWLHVSREELYFEASGRSESDRSDSRYRLHEEFLPGPGDRVTLNGTRSADFDAARVQGPLRLRSAEPGDRIRPAGMDGHKKLTALFREHSIPREKRPSMMVVEDAERIIWAVGIATAEDTRPTGRTDRILRLSLESAAAEGA